MLFYGLEWMLFLGVAGLLSLSLYHLLSIQESRFRWKRYRFQRTSTYRFWRMLRRLFAMASPDTKAEIGKRLKICRIPFDAEDFIAVKRLGLTGLVMTGAGSYGLMKLSFISGPVMNAVFIILLLIGLPLWFDKVWLGWLGRHRSRQIVKEVHMLSNQILYYGNSSMNLHGKLTECLPHTRVIRKELQWLLSEWYEDVDQALVRFKQRIGTDEGYSFAETLHAIRLHDSKPYYDLLRQRIQDYKEKMELDRESRKESVSYLLFVMAGVPILNTFRVFVYPWVEEGQRLFNMLN